MTRFALFIDLPNFYSRLLKSNIEGPRFLRNYLLDWLDLDLLTQSLTESFSGIWVFYSGEKIGPSGERIEGKHLQEYIRRINTLEGVTARDANIRGEQREPVNYKCEKCGYESISESLSEKGVDTSLIVHLFDTMDSWDTAFLLSGDADFVPAVASLRRRGKIVVGVGFSDASAALVRECYDYVKIDEVFIKQDVLTYSAFKKDGIISKWLSLEIRHDPAFALSQVVEMKVYWGRVGNYGRDGFTPSSPPSYCIGFRFQGSVDLTDRHQLMNELKKKFPQHVEVIKREGKIDGYDLRHIDPFCFEGVKRRLQSLTSSVSGLELADVYEDRATCVVRYQLNEQTQGYEPIPTSAK